MLGKIIRLTDDGGIPSTNPYTGPDSARCNLDGVPHPAHLQASNVRRYSPRVFAIHLGLRSIRTRLRPDSILTTSGNPLGRRSASARSQAPITVGQSVKDRVCLILQPTVVTPATDSSTQSTGTGRSEQLLRAALSCRTASGPLPLNAQFDGSASSDPDGDPLTCEWDFEADGTIDSTAVSPTYMYNTAGTFIAELTVTDPDGAQRTTTMRIDPGNNAPVPTMTVPADAAIYAVGDTIVFASSATDPDSAWLFCEDFPIVDPRTHQELKCSARHR